MDKVRIKRISLLSLLKIHFTGLCFFVVPLGLLFGIMGAFNFNTVVINGEAVTGPMAIIAGPLLGVVVSAIFTLILSLYIWIGLLISSRFVTFNIFYVGAHVDTEKEVL